MRVRVQGSTPTGRSFNERNYVQLNVGLAVPVMWLGRHVRPCTTKQNPVKNLLISGISNSFFFKREVCSKYCVDKDGVQLTEPLLKTDPDVTELLANMDCSKCWKHQNNRTTKKKNTLECSRAALVMTTIEKPTCLANGNYNPLQCRRGWCRCVNQNGDQVCEDENCEIEEYNQTNFSCS